VYCGEQLLAGGSVSHQFALQPGEVAAFMTTPIGSFGTNFASPDTIIDLVDSGNVLIKSNDDAGSDGRAGLPVGPVRGSLVRYGVLTADTYDFKVRGFSAADTGPYIGTYVRFTPGGSADFFDHEANDTTATAQALTIAADGAQVGFGSLTGGDLDFFSIAANPGDVITAFTIPLDGVPNNNFGSVDTILDIRAADGSIIISNDDAGGDAFGTASVSPVRGSAVRYEVGAAGSVFLSVRGFGGEDAGNYALVVSVCSIPTPGAASLMMVAGLPLMRRRRR
jgi:MYXO-CTERM domain-containing protein